MTESDFLKLIDNTKYQVFFFASKMSIPFPFALHTWIVIVDHGKIRRYDVWGSTGRSATSWGHVHLNTYKPSVGVRIFPSKKANPNARRRKGFLLYTVEGNKGSLASRMVDFINTSPQNYPYINTYRLFPGPNSNTFTSWIISHFPELEFKLPWTAVGKGYVGKLGHKIN